MQTQQIDLKTTNYTANLSILGNLVNNDVKSSAISQPNTQSELSTLAKLSISQNISDISYNSDETQFAYYKDDNSTAMRVHSTTDIQMHEERVAVELEFSAEMLGLTKKDFIETNGKPMRLTISLEQSQIHLSFQRSVKKVKTLRKPEDIINDLAKAISQIISRKGDKSITVVFDEEAITSLIGNTATKELLNMVVSLLGIINSLKLADGQRDKFIIQISGKGKPYLDVENDTRIDETGIKMELTLVINPPVAEESQNPETPVLMPEAEMSNSVDVPV